MADAPDTDDEGFDAEDIAEVMDETNLTEDGENIANFDEIPRVLDVTSTIDDADEGDGDDDPELFDEDERFDVDESEIDDSPRTRLEDRPDNTDISADDDEADAPPIDELVTTEDRNKPNRFESLTLSDEQLEELGYEDKR